MMHCMSVENLASYDFVIIAPLYLRVHCTEIFLFMIHYEFETIHVCVTRCPQFHVFTERACAIATR